MVAEENSMEIYTEARRLDNECSVFQAELLGIQMAVDWIQQQSKDKISHAIHVDSQTALFAIGHTGIRGNERADYLAKIAAGYKSTIAYNSIPMSRAKQLLENYYTNIWNATYINSEDQQGTIFLCNCPEKSPQTARHLLTECSLYSRDRPRVLTTQTLPQILKFHINTVAVTNFISNIFRTLQE
ncbi:hypothetical protein ANN_04493 [Periplaneta americana]|uniref:RNase H type-1 domain-containing protein n=1 Tax=Periplaneta americana TaxID=6978 RepID=A0ABQ8T8R1_PERAM|nr:hypothetical protein ANN_04493 [Periplaneta americana]